MEFVKKNIFIILLLILSYWSLKPLFHSNFFPIHDDIQVARVFEMHKALDDGMFPVRWSQGLGYNFGYPIFNFYAPLAYYLGALVMILGLDALSATKVMMGVGILLALVGMYLFAKEIWGRRGAFISALLYLYAPYHAVDIYVRGDVAEFFAYGFIPFVFLGIYKIYKTTKEYVDVKNKNKISALKKKIWNWVILASLSFAAVILSHNLSAMMVTPFLLIFSFCLYISLRRKEKLYNPYFIFLSLIVGILIAGFYWVPVFPMMQYTDVLSVVGGGSYYGDHFVCIGQLWDSPWGFGGSAPGCIDGISLKIGKPHLLLGLTSLIMLSFFRKKLKYNKKVVWFFTFSFVFSIFLTIEQSKFIWDILSPMAFFQFPWRFLLVATFFISFLGGGLFYVLDMIISNNKRLNPFYTLFLLTIACAILFYNAKLFNPQIFNTKTVEDYTSFDEVSWRVSKLSDEYMPPDFFRPLGIRVVPKNKIMNTMQVKILEQIEKTNHLFAVVEASSESKLTVNLAYFPGWHVYIDGRQEWFSYFNQGLIINIPEGRHDLDIVYQQTPVQIMGNILTITGSLILLIGIIKLKKDK